MRAHARTLVVLACTFGLLALFLRQTDLSAVLSEIANASPLPLLGALVTTALTYVIRAVRWQAMLLPIGPTRFSAAFRATVIGFTANFLLPARAGEVVRPYLLARREGLSVTAAFATIILERFLDLATALLLFAAYVVFSKPAAGQASSAAYKAVQTGGLLAGVTSVVGLAVMFVVSGHPEWLGATVRRVTTWLPQRLGAAVVRLAQAFAEGLAVLRRPRALLVSLLLSLPLWLSIASGIWLVSRAFHLTIPFTGTFLLIALLVVGVAVPTPGAVGGFHYAYRVGTTTFFMAPSEQAVGAAIVLHAISFIPVTLLGLVYMVQDGLSLTRVQSFAEAQRGAPHAETRLGDVPPGLADEAAGPKGAKPS